MTHLLLDSLMITGFVAGMMLLIEYFNVRTSGSWGRWLARGGLRHEPGNLVRVLKERGVCY